MLNLQVLGKLAAIKFPRQVRQLQPTATHWSGNAKAGSSHYGVTALSQKLPCNLFQPPILPGGKYLFPYVTQLSMVEAIQRQNNLCAAYIPGQYHASVTIVIVLLPVFPHRFRLSEAAAPPHPCRGAEGPCRSSVESVAKAAFQDHTDPGTHDATGRPYLSPRSERIHPPPQRSPARSGSPARFLSAAARDSQWQSCSTHEGLRCAETARPCAHRRPSRVRAHRNAAPPRLPAETVRGSSSRSETQPPRVRTHLQCERPAPAS